MPNFYYYQKKGGEEAWLPSPRADRQRLEEEDKPMFISVLAVSRIVDDDITYEDKQKLAYEGPMYFDWDLNKHQRDAGPDAEREGELLVIEKVNQFLDKLEELRVDLECCSMYATGGKGYHLEIPQQLFTAKMPPKGTVGLPHIYREMASKLAVDTLDLKIYSAGKGRMWRVCNVKRENGRFKVPITFAEMRAMTPEVMRDLTSTPRAPITPKGLKPAPEFTIMYLEAVQHVEDLLAKRKKFKYDPNAAKRAHAESIQAAMAGFGIREDVGFHQLAIQLACAAVTAGLSVEQFLQECQGLIASHKSDGNRYCTPKQREDELARLHRYMDGNACYEFSIGGIKALLNHSAPDLDGLPVTKEEIKEIIDSADNLPLEEMDEYKDVAAGITLNKFGVYKWTENGNKRICAISFAETAVLMSQEHNRIVGYEATVMVNGKSVGRQMLELDVFSGLVPFNRFAQNYGHTFTGNDVEVRVLMMRFVEQAKKRGQLMYVAKREGLDVVSIPYHDHPLAASPFIIWADNSGVITNAALNEAQVEMTFQGHPDPRGIFKTDISKAPPLAGWVKEDGNRERLRLTLFNLMSCQKPDLMGKVIGWYVSCFWKQLFQKVYGKFPLLHVNGAAGVGKCLGKDTPVLMADGTTKLVQDVKVGDQLLGPDGGVRNVLSLARGREKMYRVDPVKGNSYIVNASHILSLKKSEKNGITLADGSSIPESADVVNVNVEVFASSNKAARKSLKGWRSGPVEFHRPAGHLSLHPYALGLWLGDGTACEPSICKPEHTRAVQWWKAYAKGLGCEVSKYLYRDTDCPVWYIKKGAGQEDNPVWCMLTALNLFDNKHIPDAYKYASLDERRQLIAGMLDSDGHLIHSNYDWISSSQSLAEDFAFLCRSVGLACYVTEVRKGIRTLGFEGTYWRCCVSGDTHLLPCLDKKAEPRKQVKRVTVTGIEVTPLGVDDYYGFTIDGDHLFMLGDFTVTHNTETNILMSSLFFYRQEVRPLSPSSTTFALNQTLTSSASIPLIIDEYKPQEMSRERHNLMKLMFREAYNQRPVARGGGTRESDDFRSLQQTEMAAPLVFIAEAAEDEAATMERVVLATFSRPAQATLLRNLAKFQDVRQNHEQLGILGQYLAAKIVRTASLEAFRDEFDDLYDEAKDTYMLNERDLANNQLTDEELRNKQNAKERSVYNHTVARFGFRQWRTLVKDLFPEDADLDQLMGTLEDGIFARLADLNAATTPEHIKVLAELAQMSHHVHGDRPEAVTLGEEYAFTEYGHRSCVEIAVIPAYSKYRQYCRASGLPSLFQSPQAFIHALRDSPAFVKEGTGQVLQMPKVFALDIDELAKYGVDPFKTK